MSELIHSKDIPADATVGEAKVILRRLNKEKYGKWATNKLDKPQGDCFYTPVENEQDINHLRNAMAQGNYPLGISDCEVVGINGDCGSICPVFVRGDCETENEILVRESTQ